jgi:ribosomal protein S18 acetylase RimI-like enzyme
MNYKFRKSINGQDIELVIELVKSFGGNQSEIEKIRSDVKSKLEELGDNRVLFILEQGEEAVGVVQLLLKNTDGDPDLANGDEVAHVHALQIKKSFQRKGLASMMMKSL